MSQEQTPEDLPHENVDPISSDEEEEQEQEQEQEETANIDDMADEVANKLEEMVRRVQERAEELEKEQGQQSPEAAPSITISLIESKILFTFNKIYFEFIKDVKRTKGSNSRVGQIIKKHYKCFDKLSPASIQFVAESFASVQDVFSASSGVERLSQDERLKNTFIFKDIKIGDILPKEDTAADEACKEYDIISYYLYALYIFQHLYEEVDQENVEQIHTLFMKGIEALTQGITTESLSEVMDDDIRSCLAQVSDIRARQPSLQQQAAAGGSSDAPEASPFTAPGGSGGANPLEFLENSRIGKLAKEISSQIDMSDIKVDKPEDLLSFDKLLSGKGQFGSILEKVGSTITNKIQSGEIQQEDLIQEAMQLMGKLNLGGGAGGAGGLGGLGDMGGMMKDMLGMMSKGMGAGAKGSKKEASGTRDRLRKKLEKKRK